MGRGAVGGIAAAPGEIGNVGLTRLSAPRVVSVCLTYFFGEAPHRGPEVGAFDVSPRAGGKKFWRIFRLVDFVLCQTGWPGQAGPRKAVVSNQDLLLDVL